MKTCRTCEKELHVGDTAYMDGYFGSHFCSWEHTVIRMAEFFELVKGEKQPLEEEGYKCVTCEKDLAKGEHVYVDEYFGYPHCTWEHAVTFMAKFFEVIEGKPDVIEEYIEEEMEEETERWGDDL